MTASSVEVKKVPCRRRFRGLVAGSALLVLCAVTLGCASGSLGGLLQPSARQGTAEMWQVPPGAYPSQRLYRIRYEGPDEQRASFKLTLYLVGERQYRMLAADGLGRKLWTLDLDATGHATWLDHRNKELCHLGPADRLGFLPIARLPLVALPRLLLGRMPSEPAANLEKYDTHLTFLDRQGLRWNGSFAADELQWWTQLEGEESIAWWRREDDGGGTYAHRSSKQELRWKEVVRETLVGPLEPLEIPSRFSESICTAEDV